ncbi:MAG: hypothetical protein ACLFUU_10760 [Desulfobacteraceae bacterium]
MCIVVDTCTFASVFNEYSQDHSLFQPVLEWIVRGKGKLVYGGTKYKIELKQASKYLGVFGQLKRAGKVVEIDDVKVDERQRDIERIASEGLNDAHIIAIIAESGCRLICTKDSKATNPYFKCSDLYPPGISRPKIYSGRKQNRDLLCDLNIAKICEPVSKGTRELCNMFNI